MNNPNSSHSEKKLMRVLIVDEHNWIIGSILLRSRSAKEVITRISTTPESQFEFPKSHSFVLSKSDERKCAICKLDQTDIRHA